MMYGTVDMLPVPYPRPTIRPFSGGAHLEMEVSLPDR